MDQSISTGFRRAKKPIQAPEVFKPDISMHIIHTPFIQLQDEDIDTDDILGISKLPISYSQMQSLEQNNLKTVLKAMKQIRRNDPQERAQCVQSILPPLSMPGSVNYPIYNNDHINQEFKISKPRVI